MLVALGARVIYPPIIESGVMLPHPAIGTQSDEFDQVVIALLQEHIPLLLGPAVGVVIVSLILVKDFQIRDR